MSFKPGGGQVRSLKVDPAKKDQAMLAFIEVLSTKPAAPQQRTRPTAANAAQQQQNGAAKAAAGTSPAIKPPDPAADAKTPIVKKDQ
jgi:hypothetical protein